MLNNGTSSGNGITITTGAINNSLSYNLISGNNGDGISITGADGNSIFNNNINTNTSNGISVTSSLSTITANNILQNNGVGISLNSVSLNKITSNNVGNNTSGGVSLLNTSGTFSNNTVTGNSSFGIQLNASQDTLTEDIISDNSSHGVIINGSNNIIQHDSVFSNGTSGTGAGVFVQTGNGNSILYNSIYSNSTLGIQLGTSANNSQPYPTLNSFYSWQDNTTTTAVIGGTAVQGILQNCPPRTNYKIQFFANSNSSFREGRRYLGEMEVTTDIAGESDFFANMSKVIVNTGEFVSATATKLDTNGNTLSTSEFSSSISENTNEGLHYKVNTTLSGIPLHWANGKADYEISPSVYNKGMNYVNAILDGFHTWSQVKPLDYTQIPGDTTEQWGGNTDGINNVVWIADSADWANIVGAPEDVISVTRIRYNALNGELIDADIAFNGKPVSITTGTHFGWTTNRKRYLLIWMSKMLLLMKLDILQVWLTCIILVILFIIFLWGIITRLLLCMVE